jgi:lysophospholipase L1-like esterase
VRITRSVAAVAAAVLVLAIAPAGASAQGRWVGLGDSFAAGPLIPSQTLNPLGCLRSTRNFARLAASSTGRTLADVSCSGARTTHMTASQSTDAGTNPPQFNALTMGTNVVSVQIGGNDIGFSEILQNCATANPFGRPCQQRYIRNGVDELQARIAATASKIDAVLAGIRSGSPNARIVVVNYAAIVPHTGSGCWPQVPLAWADVPYVRGIHVGLNAMLLDRVNAARAKGTNVRLADTYGPSAGRDACRSSGTRWVEPLVPGNTAAPFHPNARGMAAFAPLVAAASNAP